MKHHHKLQEKIFGTHQTSPKPHLIHCEKFTDVVAFIFDKRTSQWVYQYGETDTLSYNGLVQIHKNSSWQQASPNGDGIYIAKYKYRPR